MDCGSIFVKLPAGSYTGTSTCPSDVFLAVELPNGLAAETKVECSRAANLGFSLNKEIKLKAVINSRMRLRVTAWQWNLIRSNVNLGSAELPLDQLTKGEEIRDMKLQLGNDIMVSATCIWKNPPPGAIQDPNADPGQQNQQMGQSLAAPGAAAASGGAAPGGAAGPGGLGGFQQRHQAIINLPDPTGHDWQLRVKIHRVRNLQAFKVDADPYNARCQLHACKRTWRSEVVKQTNDPSFDEEWACPVFEKADANFWTEVLKFDVFNARFALPDQHLASLALDFGSIYRSSPQHAILRKWFALTRNLAGDGTVMGYVKLSVSVINCRTDTAVEFDLDGQDDDEADEDIISNLMHVPGAVFESTYLHAFVICASGLPKCDVVGWCDGYVKLQFGTETARTDAIDNTKAPKWDTTLTLPFQQPCLTNFIRITLMDQDTSSPDDLIGTYLLDISDIRAGREGGLPRLFPRYLSFYAHPRSCDADYNRYFKAMAEGRREPLDYRGRLLIGFTGSRSRTDVARPRINETMLTVHVKAEVLQLSQLASDTKFKVKVFCGTAHASSKEKVPTAMVGDAPRTVYSSFVGESVNFEVQLPVVLPPDESLDVASWSRDINKADRQALAVWQQIPSVIIQLVPVGGAITSFLGAAVDKLSGQEDEEPIASLIISAEQFYTARGHRQFNTWTMGTLQDAERASDGAPPTNPLIQANCGLFITGAAPQHPSIQVSSPHEFPSLLNTAPVKKSLLLTTYLYYAKSVPAGDNSGLSDPMVVVSWANATGRSGWKSETVNPNWNEALYLPVESHDPMSQILIELWDHDMIGSDTFLAKCIVSPYVLAQQSQQHQLRWITDWTDARGRKLDNTAVLLSMQVAEAPPQAIAQKLQGLKKKQMRRGPDSRKTYLGYPIPADHALGTADYTLNLKVLSLRHMRRYRLRAISSPKLVFEIYGNRVETGRADEHLNFSTELNWNLTLPHYDGDDDIDVLPNLSMSVYDRRIGMDSLVAVATIPLSSDLFSASKKRAYERESTAAKASKLKAIMSAHKKLEEELYEDPDAMVDGDATTTGFGRVDTQEPKLDLKKKSAGSAAASSSAANLDDDQTPSAAPGHDGDLQQPLMNGGDGTSGSTTQQFMPDYTPSASEFDRVLTRNEKTQIDRKIAAAYDQIEEGAHSETDVSSEASSEPDEAFWFDRFDPASVADDPQGRLVKPHERVARFGRIGRHSKHFRGGRCTAEDVFGPFTDGAAHIQLHRGHGSSSVKAGTLVLDGTLVSRNSSSSSAAAAASSSADPAAATTFQPIVARKRTPFLARVYVLQCKDLTAMDSGLTGKSSDPYAIISLSSGTGQTSSSDIVINCKEQIRYQVLDPEFFFVRELSGELPLHCNLRVSVYDWDRIGRDELIGFTDINLEERYYSTRGYSAEKHEFNPREQLEAQNPAVFYGLSHYGCYSEKRLLRSDSGMAAGTIEMWVDLFDFANPVPRPIDVAPPPPVPLELRVVIWNVRDCDLTDEAITGELMTDIYVKCWVDGMIENAQNTDVHYRSLDGTGQFNWRMIFPCVFCPRTKKVFPVSDSTSSESGGAASTAVKKLFGVRKEAKKLKPRLKLQVWDNDLFPGSDDFIGEANLNLTQLLPTFTRREQVGLIHGLTGDCRKCYNHWLNPFKYCCNCCGFCEKQDDITEMTLEERQEVAKKERAREKEARMKQLNEEVDQRMKSLKSKFTADELPRVREKLMRQAKKATKINVFDDFTPKRQKKSAREQADQKHAAEMMRRVDRHGADDVRSIAQRAEDAKQESATAEIPRNWIATFSSFGGCRCGDVQLSFELVRKDAMEQDEKLAAGKGRSDPQKLPEPDRPDSSFFWLSSPFKSAIHIFWKNYRAYITVALCIVLGVLLGWVWLSSAVETKSKLFFT